MGNIVSAEIHIKGTRPFLWHWFGPDAIPLEKRERTGVAGNDPEEWRRSVLFTSEGRLYVEPTYLFGSIRDGSKYTKKGRGSIQKLVTATLQVTDVRVLFDRSIPGFDGGLPEELTTDNEQPVYLDVRSCVNPSTRGRNVRYRVAAAAGWQASFTIEWDKTIVSTGEMQAVLIDAGRLAGVGDGRNIGFGRYEITSVDIND